MTEQQSDKYRDEPARIRDTGLRLAFLADILLEDNYIVESVDVRNAGALLERLAASVALPNLQQRSPELIAALRARCPGNGAPGDADDEFVCECQSYEAHEQGAPCPPGCCVMADPKDMRSVMDAIGQEDAPAEGPTLEGADSSLTLPNLGHIDLSVMVGK